MRQISKQLKANSNVSSSHWDLMHEDFSFDGENFAGLHGFEGFTVKSKNFLAPLLHKLLQTKFRNFGRDFPDWKKIYNASWHISRCYGGQYDLGMLRQALTIGLLSKTGIIKEAEKIVIIGDGYGALTSLIHYLFPQKRIFSINLIKTLLVDCSYFLKAFPSSKPHFVNSQTDIEKFNASADKIAFINAESYSILPSTQAQLFVNVSSMQEMNPSIVINYFEFMRRTPGSPHFYCCNRTDKTLPDGTKSRFDDYPWSEQDKIIIDEECPWSQEYYATRPPFFRKYDGPHQHRLVRLSSN